MIEMNMLSATASPPPGKEFLLLAKYSSFFFPSDQKVPLHAQTRAR